MITARTKVKEALDKYPHLKDVLIKLSPKLSKLKNPLIFSTVARWATFADVAKISGLSLCELLHTLNRAIGKEKELLSVFPECIKEFQAEEEERPQWLERIREFVVEDVRGRDDFFLPEIKKKLSQLREGQALVVVNDFDPLPLKNMVREMGFYCFTEKPNPYEFRVIIYPAREKREGDWREERQAFEVLDVREERTDPFNKIVRKAYETPEGSGFVLVQRFEPVPLILMLQSMGFEHMVEKLGPFEYRVYFYKKPRKKEEKLSGERVPVVIQSATPAAYPIIMQLLKSERLMSRIKVVDLKVWEETEKHLGWIVSGKADISFSAVMAAAKLFDSGIDIKLLSIDIWDNFYVLTKGYRASSFGDLRGRRIYMPLFKNAPPAAVTQHLMKAFGFNPEEFEFVFGNPFGRPEQIKEAIVKGDADTVLLREPEASYALYENPQVQISLSYSQLWKKVHPGAGDLPNAGVVVKGEFLKKYPELVKIFAEELEKAVAWVREHPAEATNQSYEIMRQEPGAVELFLRRAHLYHRPALHVRDLIEEYLWVLQREGVLNFKNGLRKVMKMVEIEV